MPKKGGRIDPKGFDAGKKVSGIKRHVVVDTQGLLMHAIVHTVDIQDRDGGVLTLSTMFGLYPFLTKVFADGGYQGAKFRDALRTVLPELSIEIVGRSDTGKGLRGVAAEMGRGAHIRMAQPLPPPREGLREFAPFRTRIYQTRIHPTDVTEAV